MDFTLVLKEKYHSLSSGQKRIADYIMKSPDNVLRESAQEIGVASKTSAATVVRFSKAVGLNSLEELKIAIAKNATKLNKTHAINPIFSVDDSTKQLSDKILELITSSTQIAHRQFDYELIDQAIDYIEEANTVYLYGIGASGLVASDLYQKFNRTGKKSMYSSDTHTGLEASYYTSANDVVIAMTYSGKTKEVLLALEQAKANKTKCILITRSKDEEMQNYADIVLTLPNTEDLVRIGAISSKYSMMYTADLLFLGYIQRFYDETIEEHFIATSKITRKLKK